MEGNISHIPIKLLEIFKVNQDLSNGFLKTEVQKVRFMILENLEKV